MTCTGEFSFEIVCCVAGALILAYGRRRHQESVGALEKAWRENQELREANELLHQRMADLDVRVRAGESAVDRLRDGVGTLQKSLVEDLRASLHALAEKARCPWVVRRAVCSSLTSRRRYPPPSHMAVPGRAAACRGQKHD